MEELPPGTGVVTHVETSPVEQPEPTPVFTKPHITDHNEKVENEEVEKYTHTHVETSPVEPTSVSTKPSYNTDHNEEVKIITSRISIKPDYKYKVIGKEEKALRNYIKTFNIMVSYDYESDEIVMKGCREGVKRCREEVMNTLAKTYKGPSDTCKKRHNKSKKVAGYNHQRKEYYNGHDGFESSSMSKQGIRHHHSQDMARHHYQQREREHYYHHHYETDAFEARMKDDYSNNYYEREYNYDHYENV